MKILPWPTRALSIGAISLLMPFMAGCSGTVTSPATVTVTAESATTPTSQPTATSSASPSPKTTVAARVDTLKAAWVEYVRNRAVSGTVLGQTDDEIVASAKKMCDQMRGGDLFEEVAYDLVDSGLPKPYQTDMQMIFGSGTAQFCPEFLSKWDIGQDAAALKRLREVAPDIAHNTDSAILDQARSACPSVSDGPAHAAATVAEARRAWGHDQGYKFIFISVLNYCSGSINNVIANK